MKNSLKQTGFDSGVTKDLNHKNVFDNESPKIPDDEGRVSSNDDGLELSPVNQGNNDSDATSMDENNNTHPEGTVSNETDFINDFYENSEFNSEVEDFPVNTVKRSTRQTKLPTSLYDFVIEGKVKYGVEKVVSYANLNHENFCFASDEEIYMTIPKGFANKYNKNKVCRLVKSLYGLKQAPRKWNEKLVKVLKENDFVQSVNDHSLFTKSKNNKFIALLVNVDDIVITGNCVDEIEKFKKFLESKFKIKDLGSLKYVLGIEVMKLYMHSPLKSHLNCALNVLRYLKNASGKGIRYNHLDCKNNMKGYSDAD
uniref:Ribonuclease H-like domain-containing protein n=1 Tax=Tanacetum cinerariifolium TaxID=118510 RepID=A0A699HDB4_TANCI|nr:ribonuclease H-like domain-containing protein [Tanacetum cinerariifolium]GEX31345.1 ribonuclease H-like domain-containing protein [Tanacetum cinerariifolium]GEX92039.1 ribonuclease H-like domain-containing protein [Tanacetum cinerariifolium]